MRLDVAPQAEPVCSLIGRRRGRKVCDNWVTAKMPFSWYFLRPFSLIFASRLRSCLCRDFSTLAVYRHSAQGLFSTSGGGVGLVC